MDLDSVNTPSQSAGSGGEQNYRIQSAMVLFALEEALGAFVVQAVPQPDALPANMRSEIEKRIQGTGFIAVEQLVQATYIKEIIDLAVDTSKERAEGDALKRLRTLVESLDAFEVRNAVCHPNRQFPENYWYRMATLASDPCIEQLRLLKVTDALRCAVEGRLNSPPEGWLDQRPWSIPNNLPSTFDHQVTGLIARHNEAKDFRKRLQNLRNSLLAIVGPGGTGKTALCLEVLRDCLLSPDTAEWADELVYVSAKTERLTARGVEPISDPITSLESVKVAIVSALLGGDLTELQVSEDAFRDVTAQLHTRRVLLCIDNLETLIRDHPLEFEEFVQSLPQAWRVLVTSRVSVNGANVLSLGPIARAGAIKLARDYSSMRGAPRLDETQFERLAEVSDQNPLAIRLSIDSFAAGSELTSALAQTKDRITDFAYTSLVEHLSPHANIVLECLFGSNMYLSRGQIGSLLHLTPDEIAEAVNSLLRTSLVTREVDSSGERYLLSSSVRGLLLRTPRDAQLREEVYERLREQQRLISELNQSGIQDPLHDAFVSQEVPSHVRALVANIRANASSRSSRVQQLVFLTEVRRQLEFEKDVPVLHRTEAQLLERLGDRYGAMECYGKAVREGADDPCARLRLSELLREEQQLLDAKVLSQPLVGAGYLKNHDVSLRNKARLVRAYWLPHLWLREHDEVLQATTDWLSSGDLRPTYIGLRISAFQRSLDNYALVGQSQVDLASEMLECLSEGFRLDGYLPEIVHEGFRAFERLTWLQDRNLLSPELGLPIAHFIDRHLGNMCGSSPDHHIGGDFSRQLISCFHKVGPNGKNPLVEGRWVNMMVSGPVVDEALTNAGYEEARITNPREGYLFARSVNGARDFYVHISNTELSNTEFSELRQGQILLVLPSHSPPQGERAWPVNHAMLAQ